ncbi:hypothetical protein DU500_14700 [Haloplanus rubicundus]|uniref:Uncharacterized protein n=1 Tax=Haloplanus rubicundus TaxID=1547898 RepID=A0A345E5V5_9EURY|nr:hypothetical protein [Haloplanus rubicundus]AXG07577.1 hypothetical protein DU500_14700 [Haloplanus rubicundus]AXG10992.1 hypothetical protein DU484_14670 [Haloplanus rubicundus]
MSDTSDTRSRLDRAQRRELRSLGWRWLGRRRAKRPRSIDRRHLVDADVEETALVDLDARV